MKCPNGGTLCLGLIIGTTYGSIYRRFSRSVQLGGLGSVLDWRSHQGIRQSKLCYPLRIPPLEKERTLRQSLTIFCGLDVFSTGRKCPYLHANS